MPTLAQLEQRIGHTAFTGRKSDQMALQEALNVNPAILAATREWLCKQGLPQRNVASALRASLATAYINQPYLISWRNKVNPSWALLGGADDDIGADETSSAGANTSTTNGASNMSADMIQTLINERCTALINDALSRTTLRLDDSAKQAIRTLAQDAAAAKATELAKPRVIEIRTNVDGEARSTALGLQHECFPTLLRACQARDHKGFRLNIWLTGPTGSGKTSAAEACAQALALAFGSDGSLDAYYKVLGFRDANGNIISTEFIRIYTAGGIYIADEIDNWMPSALLSLNAALANGWMTTPAGLVPRHKDAIVIACANTWGLGATGDYVGRTRLDAASLDRFQPKIDWPYDEKLEQAIASDMCATHGQTWCNTVQQARHKAAQQGLKVIISPRATFNGIALLQAGFAQQDVVDMTLAAGISAEQKKAIGLNAAPQAPTTSSTIARDIQEDWLSGNKIQAIRHMREQYNLSLYDAKTRLERELGTADAA